MEDNKIEKKNEAIAKPTLIKKNALDKVKDGFLADAGVDLKNYIWKDVIIPSAIDLASNIFDSIFETAIGMKNVLLYKDSAPYQGRVRGRGKGKYIGYSDISRSRGGRHESDRDYKPRNTTYRLDDRFIFKTRAEADEILEKMADSIERYGVVSVFDLYEFCDETVDFTARDWGWDELVTARIKMVSGGNWEIILPKPISLR